jgi:F-type H+-transporting ATPase subunit epsilon
MAIMTVHVVSPEARLFSGEATEVYARSLEGEIGILPGHQPALLALADAPVRVKTAEGTHEFQVRGGFLSFRENVLTVLADAVN